MFPEYKANRPPPPPELIPQFDLCRQMVRAMGIAAVEAQGFEADDVIATLALRARKAGMEVTIVTSDKDMMVLVGDGVRMYDSMRENHYGPEEVEKKFGVPPEQMLDMLSLAGDTSDNIPGIPGVGPKTAAQLIQQHGDMESVLKAAPKMKGKRAKALVEHADNARLARKLIRLRDDVPFQENFDLLKPGPANRKALAELFGRLSFRKWLSDLQTLTTLYGETEDETDKAPFEPEPEPEPEPKPEGPDKSPLLTRPQPDAYKTVTKEAEFAALLKKLKQAGSFAVDLETTSIDAVRARVVGVALSTGAGRAWYVPVGHTTLEARGGQLSLDGVLKGLKPLLENPKVAKYAQNHKYEYVVLNRHGIELAGIGTDPMIASYLLDPSEMSHGLDALARRELNYQTVTYKEVCGTGKSAITFDQVDLTRATRYAAEDAEVTYLLAAGLNDRIHKQERLNRLMTEVEIPLARVLGVMELNGITLDVRDLASLSDELASRLSELEQEVGRMGGMDVNLNSPKQLQELLFKRLGLKPVKKTKSGYSTDAEVLEQLASEHPVAALIHEHRTLAKLRSTYVEALPRMVNPDTGRLHTSYNQAVAATGRLSSSDPNLQNIPVRTELGRRIRRAFIPAKGNLLVSADYSQIELRVLAHLSKDKKLTKAFKEDADIHAQTAAEVFSVNPDKVDREQRRVAKAVNFGVIYGQSAFGLAKQLRIPRHDAAKYIDRYFKHYAGVAGYMENLIKEAREKGFVTTVLGRRRPLPALSRGGHRERSAAERMARNTPIQGSAADIIKLAMLKCQDRLEQEFPESAMLLTVHDELVFEAPKKTAEKLARAMAEEMEKVYPLSVPLKVDWAMGTNWDEAH
jgi:DNA polymerase-1